MKNLEVVIPILMKFLLSIYMKIQLLLIFTALHLWSCCLLYIKQSRREQR